jgi:hypothetical protein
MLWTKRQCPAVSPRPAEPRVRTSPGAGSPVQRAGPGARRRHRERRRRGVRSGGGDLEPGRHRTSRPAAQRLRGPGRHGCHAARLRARPRHREPRHDDAGHRRGLGSGDLHVPANRHAHRSAPLPRDAHEALIAIDTLDFIEGWLPKRAHALVWSGLLSIAPSFERTGTAHVRGSPWNASSRWNEQWSRWHARSRRRVAASEAARLPQAFRLPLSPLPKIHPQAALPAASGQGAAFLPCPIAPGRNRPRMQSNTHEPPLQPPADAKQACWLFDRSALLPSRPHKSTGFYFLQLPKDSY